MSGMKIHEDPHQQELLQLLMTPTGTGMPPVSSVSVNSTVSKARPGTDTPKTSRSKVLSSSTRCRASVVAP